MKKENCKTSNRACRLSDRRFFTWWMYMARNDEFTLERAKPCRLSAPVRSISVTAAYLSTACRLKIPPPLLHYRRLIYGLIEKNTKFLPSSLALRSPIRVAGKNSSYTSSICISGGRSVSCSRRVQRKFENELKLFRFYRLRACSIRDDSNGRGKLRS